MDPTRQLLRAAATMTPTAPSLPINRWTVFIDGQHLRDSRTQNGLTRDQLASKAGISVTTIARLEGHSRTRCRSRTLAASPPH